MDETLKPLTVVCILCEHRVWMLNAYFIPDENTAVDSRGMPVDILPICGDCLMEIEALADPDPVGSVRVVSKLN